MSIIEKEKNGKIIVGLTQEWQKKDFMKFLKNYLMESKGQFTITIPKEVIEATKWKKGDKLYVGKKEDKNTLFIEKIETENKTEKKEK